MTDKEVDEMIREADVDGIERADLENRPGNSISDLVEVLIFVETAYIVYHIVDHLSCFPLPFSLSQTLNNGGFPPVYTLSNLYASCARLTPVRNSLPWAFLLRKGTGN